MQPTLGLGIAASRRGKGIEATPTAAPPRPVSTQKKKRKAETAAFIVVAGEPYGRLRI